jgi:hypothetical protein
MTSGCSLGVEGANWHHARNGNGHRIDRKHHDKTQNLLKPYIAIDFLACWMQDVAY